MNSEPQTLDPEEPQAAQGPVIGPWLADPRLKVLLQLACVSVGSGHKGGLAANVMLI